MSRFVNQGEVDIIVLRNGDQVKVRQGLTALEVAMLRKDLIQFVYEARDDGPHISATGGEWYLQQINICKAYIVSWDFKDDDGQLVTYSPDLVSTLSEDTVQEIAEAVDNLQQKRREENAKKGRQLFVK